MNSLSVEARLYIYGTLFGGGVLIFWQLANLTLDAPWLLLAACTLASIFQLFKIEGATARTSFNLSWIVYGATFVLLGVPATLLTMIAAHLIEWAWRQYPWYVQSFNIASFAITISIVGVVSQMDGIVPGPSNFMSVLTLLVVMSLFTLINHLMVGLAVNLARGQSLSQTGVLTWTTLTIDFGLLSLGASAALIWQVNPFATILIVIVAYLFNSVLKVPALERQSETDAKTGLFNARYFEDAIGKEVARAERSGKPFSVIMADLDELREINNTFGHLAGDAVIKKIAQILQASARDIDVVARFGGEEFGILMPNISSHDAYVQTEAMRKAIEAAEFTVSTSSTPIKATISFGIAEYSNPTLTPKELIHNADLAVYKAKHWGRNQTCIYEKHVQLRQENPHVLDEQLGGINGLNGGYVMDHRKMIRPIAKSRSFGLSQATPWTETTAAKKTPETPKPVVEGAHNNRLTNLYVIVVSFIALFALGILIDLDRLINANWMGLLVFVLLAATLEAFATDMTEEDTSVSTSVAPLIAGALAFGPVGALALSLTITTVTVIKHRLSVDRIFFNISNHLLGSLLCVGLVFISGQPFITWPIPIQLMLTIMSAGLIYISTTGLLAGIISVDSEQSVSEVWLERFRWLGPHYLALGLVAYALVFNHFLAGPLGVLILLVPLSMLHFSQRQFIESSRSIVEQLRNTNEEHHRQQEKINRLNDELLLAVASTINLRDPYVLAHSVNVARYAVLTAQELGLSPERVEAVRRGGLMHDIGKLGIPEAILFKPDHLTNEEYEIVQDHVSIGADLLAEFDTLGHFAQFVRFHHEHYDGNGYPNGLRGNEIPLEARILALADAVEAMASDRPYRMGMDVEQILAEIDACAGTQFDPDVVEAFHRVVEQHGDSVIINSARSLFTEAEMIVTHRFDELSIEEGQALSPQV